jgi:DNA helicase HerA-like ATPase
VTPKQVGVVASNPGTGRGDVEIYLTEGLVTRGSLLYSQWQVSNVVFRTVMVVSSIRYQDIYSTPDAIDVEQKVGINLSPIYEGNLPGRYRLGTARLLLTARKSGQRWSRLAPIPPPPRAPVFLLDQAVFDEIFGGCTRCVELGTLEGTDGITVKIDVNSILTLHTGIFGSTGAGKTHLASLIIEQLSTFNPRPYVLVLDMSGEYSTVISQLNGTVFDAFTTLIPDLKVLTGAEFVEIAGRVLTSDLQREIVEIGFDQFRQSLGSTPQDLLNTIQHVATQMKAQQTTITNLMTRLRGFLASLYPNLSAQPTQISLLANALNKGPVAVRVRDSRQLNIVIRWLYSALRQMRAQNMLQRRAVLLFIDEAHLVVPRNGDTIAKDSVLLMLRQGRHDGLYLVLITQDPSALDPEVHSLLSTIFVMNLPRAALGPLREKIPILEEIDLSTLPPGIGVLSGPVNKVPFPLVVRVSDKRVTSHVAVTLPIV